MLNTYDKYKTQVPPHFLTEDEEETELCYECGNTHEDMQHETLSKRKLVPVCPDCIELRDQESVIKEIINQDK